MLEDRFNFLDFNGNNRVDIPCARLQYLHSEARVALFAILKE